jgi:hypothetical protein
LHHGKAGKGARQVTFPKKNIAVFQLRIQQRRVYRSSYLKMLFRFFVVSGLSQKIA